MNYFSYLHPDFEITFNGRNICTGIKKHENYPYPLNVDELVGLGIEELFSSIFSGNPYSRDFFSDLGKIMHDGMEADLLISMRIPGPITLILWGTYLYRIRVHSIQGKLTMNIYNTLVLAKLATEVFNVDTHNNLVNAFKVEKSHGNVTAGNIAWFDGKIQLICNLSFAELIPNYANRLKIINAIRYTDISRTTLYNDGKRGSVSYHFENLVSQYSYEVVQNICNYDCFPVIRLRFNTLFICK